jgi:hypothetical protein
MKTAGGFQMKKEMLLKQGFKYEPRRMIWVNRVARKAISEDAVDDRSPEEIRTWIHRLHPQGQSWDVMLSKDQPTREKELAADLGWV